MPLERGDDDADAGGDAQSQRRNGQVGMDAIFGVEGRIGHGEGRWSGVAKGISTKAAVDGCFWSHAYKLLKSCCYVWERERECKLLSTPNLILTTIKIVISENILILSKVAVPKRVFLFRTHFSWGGSPKSSSTSSQNALFPQFRDNVSEKISRIEE